MWLIYFKASNIPLKYVFPMGDSPARPKESLPLDRLPLGAFSSKVLREDPSSFYLPACSFVYSEFSFGEPYPFFQGRHSFLPLRPSPEPFPVGEVEFFSTPSYSSDFHSIARRLVFFPLFPIALLGRLAFFCDRQGSLFSSPTSNQLFSLETPLLFHNLSP